MVKHWSSNNGRRGREQKEEGRNPSHVSSRPTFQPWLRLWSRSLAHIHQNDQSRKSARAQRPLHALPPVATAALAIAAVTVTATSEIRIPHTYSECLRSCLSVFAVVAYCNVCVAFGCKLRFTFKVSILINLTPKHH